MGKCLFLRKGETHTAPISGIMANTLAVGSTVKLMENGVAAEYLVVHQGLPSSMYDASCDGCWLLRKDCLEPMAWSTSNVNDYENSNAHSYLNGSFFNLLGSIEQSSIKQIRIPYRASGGYSTTITSGANGLQCKVFLLSFTEINCTGFGYTPDTEGGVLDYFSDCATSAMDEKRSAYRNGTKQSWWTRSPFCKKTGGSKYVFDIAPGGMMGSTECIIATYTFRPSLILPSTAIFDKNTLILKGVA